MKSSNYKKQKKNPGFKKEKITKKWIKNKN